jgi:invasion protein IalB
MRKLGSIVPRTALAAAALVFGWGTTGHPADEAAAGQWHHSCRGDPMRCALSISIQDIALTLGCAGKEKWVLLASSQRSLIEGCAIQIDKNETISGTVVRGKCWFLARFKTRTPDLIDQMKQGDQALLRIDRDSTKVSLKGFAEELAKLD